MIKRLSERIAVFWVSGDIIQQDDAEIYAYGLQLVLSTTVNVVFTILISMIVGLPMAWLPFLTAFIPLRTTAGGYHASSHFLCILSFCTTFAVFAVLIRKFALFSSLPYLALCSILSLVMIFLMSPVQASNKPLTRAEALRNRTKSLMIATAFFIPEIAAILIPELQGKSIAAFYSGELSAALSLILAKIKNRARKPASGS